METLIWFQLFIAVIVCSYPPPPLVGAIFTSNGVIEEGRLCSQGVPANANRVIDPASSPPSSFPFNLTFYDEDTFQPVVKFRSRGKYTLVLSSESINFQAFLVTPDAGDGFIVGALSSKTRISKICGRSTLSLFHSDPSYVSNIRSSWQAPIDGPASFTITVQPSLNVPTVFLFRVSIEALSHEAQIFSIGVAYFSSTPTPASSWDVSTYSTSDNSSFFLGLGIPTQQAMGVYLNVNASPKSSLGVLLQGTDVPPPYLVSFSATTTAVQLEIFAISEDGLASISANLYLFRTQATNVTKVVPPTNGIFADKVQTITISGSQLDASIGLKLLLVSSQYVSLSPFTTMCKNATFVSDNPFMASSAVMAYDSLIESSVLLAMQPLEELTFDAHFSMMDNDVMGNRNDTALACLYSCSTGLPISVCPLDHIQLIQHDAYITTLRPYIESVFPSIVPPQATTITIHGRFFEHLVSNETSRCSITIENRHVQSLLVTANASEIVLQVVLVRDDAESELQVQCFAHNYRSNTFLIPVGPTTIVTLSTSPIIYNMHQPLSCITTIDVPTSMLYVQGRFITNTPHAPNVQMQLSSNHATYQISEDVFNISSVSTTQITLQLMNSSSPSTCFLPPQLFNSIPELQVIITTGNLSSVLTTIATLVPQEGIYTFALDRLKLSSATSALFTVAKTTISALVPNAVGRVDVQMYWHTAPVFIRAGVMMPSRIYVGLECPSFTKTFTIEALENGAFGRINAFDTVSTLSFDLLPWEVVYEVGTEKCALTFPQQVAKTSVLRGNLITASFVSTLFSTQQVSLLATPPSSLSPSTLPFAILHGRNIGGACDHLLLYTGDENVPSTTVYSSVMSGEVTLCSLSNGCSGNATIQLVQIQNTSPLPGSVGVVAMNASAFVELEGFTMIKPTVYLDKDANLETVGRVIKHASGIVSIRKYATDSTRQYSLPSLGISSTSQYSWVLPSGFETTFSELVFPNANEDSNASAHVFPVLGSQKDVAIPLQERLDVNGENERDLNYSTSTRFIASFSQESWNMTWLLSGQVFTDGSVHCTLNIIPHSTPLSNHSNSNDISSVSLELSSSSPSSSSAISFWIDSTMGGSYDKNGIKWVFSAHATDPAAMEMASCVQSSTQFLCEANFSFTLVSKQSVAAVIFKSDCHLYPISRSSASMLFPTTFDVAFAISVEKAAKSVLILLNKITSPITATSTEWMVSIVTSELADKPFILNFKYMSVSGEMLTTSAFISAPLCQTVLSRVQSIDTLLVYSSPSLLCFGLMNCGHANSVSLGNFQQNKAQAQFWTSVLIDEEGFCFGALSIMNEDLSIFLECNVTFASLPADGGSLLNNPTVTVLGELYTLENPVAFTKGSGSPTTCAVFQTTIHPNSISNPLSLSMVEVNLSWSMTGAPSWLASLFGILSPKQQPWSPTLAKDTQEIVGGRIRLLDVHLSTKRIVWTRICKLNKIVSVAITSLQSLGSPSEQFNLCSFTTSAMVDLVTCIGNVPGVFPFDPTSSSVMPSTISPRSSRVMFGSDLASSRMGVCREPCGSSSNGGDAKENVALNSAPLFLGRVLVVLSNSLFQLKPQQQQQQHIPTIVADNHPMRLFTFTTSPLQLKLESSNLSPILLASTSTGKVTGRTTTSSCGGGCLIIDASRAQDESVRSSIAKNIATVPTVGVIVSARDVDSHRTDVSAVVLPVCTMSQAPQFVFPSLLAEFVVHGVVQEGDVVGIVVVDDPNFNRYVCGINGDVDMLSFSVTASTTFNIIPVPTQTTAADPSVASTLGYLESSYGAEKRLAGTPYQFVVGKIVSKQLLFVGFQSSFTVQVVDGHGNATEMMIAVSVAPPVTLGLINSPALATIEAINTTCARSPQNACVEFVHDPCLNAVNDCWRQVSFPASSLSCQDALALEACFDSVVEDGRCASSKHATILFSTCSHDVFTVDSVCGNCSCAYFFPFRGTSIAQQDRGCHLSIGEASPPNSVVGNILFPFVPSLGLRSLWNSSLPSIFSLALQDNDTQDQPSCSLLDDGLSVHSGHGELTFENTTNQIFSVNGTVITVKSSNFIDYENGQEELVIEGVCNVGAILLSPSHGNQQQEQQQYHVFPPISFFAFVGVKDEPSAVSLKISSMAGVPLQTLFVPVGAGAADDYRLFVAQFPVTIEVELNSEFAEFLFSSEAEMNVTVSCESAVDASCVLSPSLLVEPDVSSSLLLVTPSSSSPFYWTLYPFVLPGALYSSSLFFTSSTNSSAFPYAFEVTLCHDVVAAGLYVDEMVPIEVTYGPSGGANFTFSVLVKDSVFPAQDSDRCGISMMAPSISCQFSSLLHPEERMCKILIERVNLLEVRSPLEYNAVHVFTIGVVGDIRSQYDRYNFVLQGTDISGNVGNAISIVTTVGDADFRIISLGNEMSTIDAIEREDGQFSLQFLSTLPVETVVCEIEGGLCKATQVQSGSHTLEVDIMLYDVPTQSSSLPQPHVIVINATYASTEGEMGVSSTTTATDTATTDATTTYTSTTTVFDINVDSSGAEVTVVTAPSLVQFDVAIVSNQSVIENYNQQGIEGLPVSTNVGMNGVVADREFRFHVDEPISEATCLLTSRRIDSSISSCCSSSSASANTTASTCTQRSLVCAWSVEPFVCANDFEACMRDKLPGFPVLFEVEVACTTGSVSLDPLWKAHPSSTDVIELWTLQVFVEDIFGNHKTETSWSWIPHAVDVLDQLSSSTAFPSNFNVVSSISSSTSTTCEETKWLAFMCTMLVVFIAIVAVLYWLRESLREGWEVKRIIEDEKKSSIEMSDVGSTTSTSRHRYVRGRGANRSVLQLEPVPETESTEWTVSNRSELRAPSIASDRTYHTSVSTANTTVTAFVPNLFHLEEEVDEEKEGASVDELLARVDHLFGFQETAINSLLEAQGFETKSRSRSGSEMSSKSVDEDGNEIVSGFGDAWASSGTDTEEGEGDGEGNGDGDGDDDARVREEAPIEKNKLSIPDGKNSLDNVGDSPSLDFPELDSLVTKPLRFTTLSPDEARSMTNKDADKKVPKKMPSTISQSQASSQSIMPISTFSSRVFASTHGRDDEEKNNMKKGVDDPLVDVLSSSHVRIGSFQVVGRMKQRLSEERLRSNISDASYLSGNEMDDGDVDMTVNTCEVTTVSSSTTSLQSRDSSTNPLPPKATLLTSPPPMLQLTRAAKKRINGSKSTGPQPAVTIPNFIQGDATSPNSSSDDESDVEML
eukprot:m.123643 g.123643  ORF g.123643 m.123643 type:complete len:3213 (-) comp9414_c2_seq1:190-9828(-)